jgi:hypothetical protein
MVNDIYSHTMPATEKQESNMGTFKVFYLCRIYRSCRYMAMNIHKRTHMFIETASQTTYIMSGLKLNF